MKTWRGVLFLSLAVSGLSTFAIAQRGAAPAQGAAPAGAASTGVRVYISDETGNAVAVVDPVAGTVLESLAVGKRPRGLKVSGTAGQLLVALSGSPLAPPGTDESKLPPPDRAADGIGIVDLATHKVLRIKSGNDPESFDVSPDGKTAYVSNEDAGELTVLDLVGGKIVRRVKVGEEPEGVTVRPDGQVVYVTSEGNGEVIAVNTKTYAVAGRMKTGDRPRGIAFTADGAIALVTCENDATVYVLDAKLHKVLGSIAVPKPAGAPTVARPMGIVMSPDSKTAYVTLGRAKAIAVIDVATRKVARTIDDVGDRPWGIGISPNGQKLYTANGGSGDVSIVDIASGKVDKKIAVGKSPWGITVKK